VGRSPGASENWEVSNIAPICAVAGKQPVHQKGETVVVTVFGSANRTRTRNLLVDSSCGIF
jgi:hypothetical protein